MTQPSGAATFRVSLEQDEAVIIGKVFDRHRLAGRTDLYPSEQQEMDLRRLLRGRIGPQGGQFFFTTDEIVVTLSALGGDYLWDRANEFLSPEELADKDALHRAYNKLAATQGS